MSNPLEVIGHDLRVAAVDTEHAAVKIVDFLPHAAEVLATAIRDQPQVKTLILDLIKQASSVIANATTAVTDRGVNLAADASTLASAEAFFGWLKTAFVPAVEAIYTEIAADIK